MEGVGESLSSYRIRCEIAEFAAYGMSYRFSGKFWVQRIWDVINPEIILFPLTLITNVPAGVRPSSPTKRAVG